MSQLTPADYRLAIETLVGELWERKPHIKRIRVALYGMNSFAVEFISATRETSVEVVGVTDSKWWPYRKTYHGIPVYQPERLPESTIDFILIMALTPNFQNEIIKFLKNTDIRCPIVSFDETISKKFRTRKIFHNLKPRVLLAILLQSCKKLFLYEENYRHITLRIRITRYIFWMFHILLAIILIILSKVKRINRLHIIEDSMIERLVNSFWKYNIASILHKIEEGYYFNKASIRSPSLEIGTGQGDTSAIFFTGKKIDIASDLSWRNDITREINTDQLEKVVQIFDSFLACDTHALPIKKNKLQDIVMVHIVDHIPHVDKMLSEIGSALRPGGNFYFSGYSSYWSRPEAADEHKVPSYLGYSYNLFTENEWKELIEAHGMELMNCRHFLSGKRAILYRVSRFLYHARRDGLKIFEKSKMTDKLYEDMIRYFLIPLCEKDLLETQKNGEGIQLWIHARKK